MTALFIAVLVLIIGSDIWVWIDFGRTKAAYGDDLLRMKRGDWVAWLIVLWVVFFPWYLVCRSRQRR